MVTSVTSTSVAASATTAAATASSLASRPHAEDAAKRPDATTKPAAEEDSTVVQISRQGAQLAAQSVASQPAQVAAAAPKPADADAATKAASSASSVAATSSSSSKPDAAFEPADGNKDGSVTEFEKQAYDFKHPKTLAELIAEEKNNAAPSAAAAGTGLKAYEQVARS